MARSEAAIACLGSSISLLSCRVSGCWVWCCAALCCEATGLDVPLPDYPRRGSTGSWQNRSMVESRLVRVRVRVRPSKFIADSKHHRHSGHIKTTHASNATPPGHLPLRSPPELCHSPGANRRRQSPRQTPTGPRSWLLNIQLTRCRNTELCVNIRTSYAIL